MHSVSQLSVHIEADQWLHGGCEGQRRRITGRNRRFAESHSTAGCAMDERHGRKVGRVGVEPDATPCEPAGSGLPADRPQLSRYHCCALCRDPRPPVSTCRLPVALRDI